MTRSIGGTQAIRVLHHNCGYAWRRFQREAPSAAREVEPCFLQMARELSHRITIGERPHAKWPRWRKGCSEQSVGDVLKHAPLVTATTEKEAGKTARVLKPQLSDASTAATVVAGNDMKKAGKRSGRRARARKHMEEYLSCRQHFGGESDGGSITLSAKALCAILEGSEEDADAGNIGKVGDLHNGWLASDDENEGSASATSASLEVEQADSGEEEPTNLATTSPRMTPLPGEDMRVHGEDDASGAGVEEGDRYSARFSSDGEIQACVSNTYASSGAEHADSYEKVQPSLPSAPSMPTPLTDGDIKRQGVEESEKEAARTKWEVPGRKHFEVDEIEYIRKMPIMPTEGDEGVWRKIPLEAVNILQRLRYHCHPADHTRLMMLILEAIVGKLQEPCRRFYNHKDRAWDILMAVDMAKDCEAFLGKLKAFESTCRELCKVLKTLEQAAERVREDGGDPGTMLKCWPPMQKCLICVHLSGKWLDEGRSGENPMVEKIQKGVDKGPTAGPDKEDIQAILQARLRASTRR